MKFVKSIVTTLLSLPLITSCKAIPDVGNPNEADAGLYLLVNDVMNKDNMLHKTKYKDTDEDTYVIGFKEFDFSDAISIFDANNKKKYGYNDLFNEYQYNELKLFPVDNDIQILTSRKIGIEFSRNGNNKIRLHFVNDPNPRSRIESLISNDPIKVVVNNQELTFDTVNDYPNDSDANQEYTWFMKNSFITNCRTNLEYLNSYQGFKSISLTLNNVDSRSMIEIKSGIDVNDENCLFKSDFISLRGSNMFRITAGGSINITMEYFPFIDTLLLTNSESSEYYD